MADIFEHFKLMIAAVSEPVLTSFEIEGILGRFAMVDAQGREADDLEWSPVYDLNGAAAMAWLIKSGKLAQEMQTTTFSGGNPTAVQSYHQKYEHCVGMSKLYANKTAGTVSIKTPLGSEIVLI